MLSKTDSTYLRLRHLAREGNARADELNVAAEAIIASYSAYRNTLYDRVSSGSMTAFDDYCETLRRGNDLLVEVAADA